MRRFASLRPPLLLLAPLLLLGCEDQSMTEQPKNNPLTPSSVWADGTSARPLPPHVVVTSDLAREAAAATPPPMTTTLLERGHQRFDIYCSPCHGLAGHGDGMIVERGFPPPPDYASPRLRQTSARHIFDVITDGYGVMYPYKSRVGPADRWAIVAYVRALQVASGVEAAKVLKPGERGP